MVVPCSVEPTIQTAPELFTYSKVDIKQLEDSSLFESGEKINQMSTEIKCIKRLVWIEFFLS